MSKETKKIEISEMNLEYTREGLKMLKKKGINPDHYRECFEVMNDNDFQFIHNIPNFSFMKLNRNFFEKGVKNWEELKNDYQEINEKKLTKDTGKKIVKKMKKLLVEFDLLFQEYVKENDGLDEDEIKLPSEELNQKRIEILELSKDYSNLPAYLSYRHYWRYILNPEGKRGYQIKKDKNKQK